MTNSSLEKFQPVPAALQSAIEARGLEIFALMQGASPGVFSYRNVSGRLMDWSMRNENLKVQLFRFVDVLPCLTSPKEIARHAQEYLGDGAAGLPAWAEWGVKWSPRLPWLTAWASRLGVHQMARTFILAPNGAAAVPGLKAMRRTPLAFTVDILGETVVGEREADEYQARYLELIESLAREAGHWPEAPQIDRDDQGPLPRVNISVKLSALTAQIHATDPEGAMRQIAGRLRPLLLAARERGVFINFDMESSGLKELTLALFMQLLDEPAMRDYPHVGLAFQAYLRESPADLERLIAWSRTRSQRITIRLIKGAYWDWETVIAAQRGWPVPVFQRKVDTDANYERLARRLLENEQFINCAFASHSVRSLAAVMVMADELKLPRRRYEFQMLHGMAEPIKGALVQMGYRVRDYCPIGEVLPGMGYLVRRLLENTSNEGFLRATFADHVAPRELLRDPAAAPAAPPPAPPSPPTANLGKPMDEVIFNNEPLTDFALAENRERMRAALVKVRAGLGGKFPLVIGGRECWTDREWVSRNPANPKEVIGRVAMGGRAEADAAVAAGLAAFPDWRRQSVATRAAVLERTAELLRQERFEICALEVFETGKPWIESDADVAEAIDFCYYYAGEMRRIASSRYVVPGETSLHQYSARGLSLVIAPWNFPLAILCGMVTAAMVAGNAVIMKPAEQSSVVAAKFMDLLQRAGTPPGVVNFLPGPGEDVGAYLVDHPRVDLIAFTGSREVGLKIYEAAGRTRPGQRQLKRVVCEMGGKNALIIDSDADLDEAVPAALYSAFGFQGQKCSALSRLIVLQENYDRVVERLVEAAKNWTVGLPEDPASQLGPVIDEAAFQRISKYLELGKQEGQLAFQGTIPAGDGYFVPPTIFKNIAPQSRLAQEEIFGPVLCVLKAANLDEALAWANGTEYALTGGLFSRSPANIERVKAEFEVGNLYINRGITGALVARHPFGGFKMSGGGTKAGGRDYLQNFLIPRVVTENNLRRGFAPEEKP